MVQLDLSHPGAKELLEKGGIAVTMEEIFTKFSRSDGGLFSMFGAYQRWCRITSARAEFFERMLEMCGLIDDKGIATRG